VSLYKEIVTKAVIGKGKKYFKDSYSLEATNKPTTILGCWVINHKFNGYKTGDKIGVNGSFDVNIWYSYDNDTKTAVSTKRFSYLDKITVPIKNGNLLDNTNEIIVRSLKQPTVSKADIKGNDIELTIEKEMGVEIVGNTKVKISVEDIEDDYEEVLDEELSNEIDSINEDYLENE
jgi:spore coat protein E